MPEICKQESSACYYTQDNPLDLAICCLVPRYGRTIQAGSRQHDPHLGDGDKFTKWIEVKPIRKCDGKTAVKFLKDIILRYGYPHSIITDNGTNFAEGPFPRFCRQKNIRLDLASVTHPQSNGQVERANGMILSGIKP